MYGTAVYNIHILTPSYYEIISNHKPYFMWGTFATTFSYNIYTERPFHDHKM
jgi:hypothetical protein